MNIHKTAIISKKAKIAEGVKVGPYVVIEDDVKIGRASTIGAGSYIYSGTTIGNGCRIFNNVALGAEPQDLGFKKAKSFLKIGDRNIFREYATAHRGTENGSSTIIGDDNYFMAFSHIGHNCIIHDNIVVCNNTLLAGYVEIEDKAFISGNCTVHQFVKIGKLAMIGGNIRVLKDIPPFMLTRRNELICGYNAIGLRRADMPRNARQELKLAYKILFKQGLNIPHALEKIEQQCKTQDIKYLVNFIRNSKRGITYKSEDKATG